MNLRSFALRCSRLVATVLIVLLMLAVSACKPSPAPAPAPSPSPTTAPAPTVSIISPTGGALAPGDVTVSVRVSNFNVVDKLGMAAVPGEGHVHYFVDVAAPTMPGQPAVTGPGTYAAVIATSYTWHNVTLGKHTFSVELVNNDHTPLNPPVVATVSVTVATPAIVPQLTISSPKEGDNLPAGNITVSVGVSSFNLTAKLGQPNVPGEGHVHYFMDVEAPIDSGRPAVTAPGTYAATAATSYTWNNVAPGKHTFSVELVNNDHTPLTPPVVVRATVFIQGSTALGVKITSPGNYVSVAAGSVTVSLQIANFKIVDKLGQVNVPGEGHIYYYLDVEPPVAQGLPAATYAAGSYWATTATSYTWSNVLAGTHTFAVQLVNNDHTPLNPPVNDRVFVTVLAPGTVQQTVSVNLTVSSTGFDTTTINIPVAASVTVNFTNKDNGTQHNFAVYDSSAAIRVIFKGAITTGPATVTYNFTAPLAAGTYFFRDDLHPEASGSFVVGSPSPPPTSSGY